MLILKLEHKLLSFLDTEITIIPDYLLNTVWQILIICIALFLGLLIFKTAQFFINTVLYKAIKKSKNTWDDTLIKYKVLSLLPHLFPTAFFYSASHLIFPIDTLLQTLFSKAALIALIWICIRMLTRLLDSVAHTVKQHPLFKNQPLTSYTQVLKLVLYIIAIIQFIAIILDKNPTVLISGIGALTAVLLLVFKDSILGLVASFQISANDMVRVGDWIEMPDFNADGDVLDVSLTTVKVQNWDKTITTIPSYALVSNSFKNWRGMSESGGRRIKRAINIDIQSIRFLTPEDIKRLKEFTLLTDYLNKKEEDLNKTNTQNIPKQNHRRLTNIGTFRAYIKAYLANNPKIATEGFTFLIRQLAATETGLPIEIYVFSKEQNWVLYEEIQADIFDHLFAIAAAFDIIIFQNPSGRDFKAVIK